ncbi:acetyltransferase (GNAT) family protein [Fontibacillus phaseoli]|uniref:Acetyltransferase (GNAT) family protein n=1 Tax=Fontibacillus phaseoli TaxID=1416533 RepID=A0A369BIT8_9BACL|nr:GNAT family N-acetyltransferase [Fontibacillus phaseoli]RCX21512.1 acetyltransferase (GNAT) family protein [Fontibacillus phaseoli]
MPDPKLFVRVAVKEDIPSLVELNYQFNGVQRSEAEVETDLLNKRETIAVAVLEEQIVGFACGQIYKSFCYAEHQAEITEMYVQESARRNGFAVMMIELLEEIFKNSGVKHIKILTGLKNIKAIKTYEKASYNQEDEQVLSKELE